MQTIHRIYETFKNKFALCPSLTTCHTDDELTWQRPRDTRSTRVQQAVAAATAAHVTDRKSRDEVCEEPMTSPIDNADTRRSVGVRATPGD